MNQLKKLIVCVVLCLSISAFSLPPHGGPWQIETPEGAWDYVVQTAAQIGIFSAVIGVTYALCFGLNARR